MDEKFPKLMEAKLLNVKKRLEKQIKDDEKYPEYGYSEEDNTQEMEEYSEKLGVEKKLIILLKDINKALIKINKKSYGICENCKGNIEQGRLKIYPAASLCSDCASKRR